jgi:hypothetical protein
VTVPAYRYTIQAGEQDADIVWDSSGVQTYGPDPDKHGIIQWDSTGQAQQAKYSDRRTLMLLGLRVVEGSPGRIFDGHNIPSDQPYGWEPLFYQGGPKSQVAPFAIDYRRGSSYEGQTGLMYIAEAESVTGRYHWTIINDTEMDARRNQQIWLWVDITWGRTDGTTPKQGSIKIGLPDEPAPRVNVAGINTHYFGQHMVALWCVNYWYPTFPNKSVCEVAGPRVGHSVQEVLADQPRFAMSWEQGVVTPIPDWPGDQRVPAWLGGVTPPPDPEPEPPGGDLQLKKLAETNNSLTLGWTPPAEQWGYLPTIDGSDKLTDGKRHIGVGAGANSVKFGKPSGETNPASKHRYGVTVLELGTSAEYP